MSILSSANFKKDPPWYIFSLSVHAPATSEVHYYMVYIAYFTELDLQICDYAQNDAFVAKIENMRLTPFFTALFFKIIFFDFPSNVEVNVSCLGVH